MQTQAASKKPTIRRRASRAAREATSTPIAAALRSGAIRAKLVLGGANDPQESEADRVADRVVSMPTPAPAPTAAPAATVTGPGPVRRESDAAAEEEEPAQALRREESPETGEEELQTLRRTEATPEEDPLQTLRRQESGESEEELQTLRREEAPAAEEPEASGSDAGATEGGDTAEGGGDEAESGPLAEPSEDEMQALAGEVQAKAAPGGGEIAPATASRVLAPGPGRPLDSGTRAFMEPRFGADFSGVRVHDSPEDKETASKLGARAFAHGSHVWLGPNERTSDRRLIAHELTHVVQNKPGLMRRADGPVRSARSPQAQPRVRRLLGWLPDWAKEKLSGWAKHVPGFSLLTFVLGKNPITGKAVERNAINLVGAIMGLIPGGTKLFELLSKSGALQKFFTWVSGAFSKLNLSLSLFVNLIKRAWDEVSIRYSISRNIQIIKDVFAPTFSRIWKFIKTLGKKVLEFVFEGAMAIAGPLATRVLGVLRKAGSVIMQIISDPIGFIGNLVKALMQGFNQFKANILEHLKQGIFGWLFGALGDAGLTLPKEFNLKGIVSIVTQVLGLTYKRIRVKLVKVMGEKRVAMFEKAFEVLKILLTEGVAGVWKRIVEHMGSLKELVIGKIRDWVVTKIVTAAVTKLVSMFNPAGAIIQAVIAIYNTVRFFIERIKQIADLVESVFNSIGAIAAGKLSAAANFVEKSMAKTIPVIISFLARLIGLGGISAKIKDIIKSIQKKVDKAIDKIIGFIVKKGKALWGRAKAKAKEKVKQLLGLKDVPIKTEEGEHNLKTKLGGAAPEVELHSDPQTLRGFLTRTESDPTLQDERADKYRKEARAELAKLDPMLAALDKAGKSASNGGKNAASSGEVTELNRAAQEQLDNVARPIRLLIDQRSKAMKNLGDIDKAKVRHSRYDLEGQVATYAQMPREGGDMLTPDHQPQAAALKHAARMAEFTPAYGSMGKLKEAAESGHARGALTINLRNIRHKLGATYGQSPSKFKGEADQARDAARAGMPGDATPEQIGRAVRRSVVGVLRKYAVADADAMDEVYSSTDQTTEWKDVGDLYTKNTGLAAAVKEDAAAVIARVTKQVNAGERQIRGQDMSHYES